MASSNARPGFLVKEKSGIESARKKTIVSGQLKDTVQGIKPFWYR